MKRATTGVASLLFLVSIPFCANVLPSSVVPHQASLLNDWAMQAVSADAVKAQQAVRELRQAGPQGLQALEARRNRFQVQQIGLQGQTGTPRERWIKAMEQVGAQHDNWAAGLYWYTDLEKAKAAAQAQNKPILSLRLLGNLDEELSCANSRFFRTALYPHAQINKKLRDDFILHWQSVRPVPKVTIDFGDGRKMETTITGNSIHYVLDSQGRILDALPGLYGPGAFARWLEGAGELERGARALGADERSSYLSQAHRRGLERITREWQEDIARTGVALTTPSALQQTASTPTPPVLAPDEILIAAPTARTAAPLAMTKKLVEAPLLRGITVAVPRDRAALERKTDDALWEKIALQHLADARLDANSLQVFASKKPRAPQKFINFEASIALDTVRNEYLRHGVLHHWLAENPNAALEQFNKRVYAELFQTPDSDPWLGLLPAEVYTGIVNDGITTSRP